MFYLTTDMGMAAAFLVMAEVEEVILGTATATTSTAAAVLVATLVRAVTQVKAMVLEAIKSQVVMAKAAAAAAQVVGVLVLV